MMPNESLRKRWLKSVNAHLVPLPPEPTWKDLPEATRIPYAMTDAVAHLKMHELLFPRLAANGLRQIYEIDRGVLPTLMQMEQTGMAVDVKALRDVDAMLAIDFARTCKKINDIADREINPLSPVQVGDFLFNELDIAPTRRNKSGSHSTADKYLKARKGEHDVIKLIIAARQLSKYRGTYTVKLPSMLRDGRYYPEYKYTRTPSGRLAEQIILLMPKHDPLAKEENRINRAKAIRNCFHATDGRQLVSVDLSQIELRVAAHESKDKVLCDAFSKGEDLHARTAHELLGAPKGRENQDDSKHRLPSKTLNFAVINGTTEYGVLDQLHEQGQLQWDIEQTREMLTGWFRLHKGFAEFWELKKAEGRRTGFVRDMFGRRRDVSGLWSHDERIVKDYERKCLFSVQSGADGISKIWNRKIWNEVVNPREGRRYVKFWVRVHDDTTLEVDERIARTVRQEMLKLVPQVLRVPTLAEGKIGQRWGEL